MMSVHMYYSAVGIGLVGMGLFALFVQTHLVRKILALNVIGAGIFLILIALAFRNPGDRPDPVPHAMVLTGIVVSVSATALALALVARIRASGAGLRLPEDGADEDRA